MMRLPMPVRVHPLVAWTIVLVGVCSMFLIFFLCEPVAYALLGVMQSSSDMPDQAAGPTLTLRVEWYLTPVIITVFLVLWAILAITRKQPVTMPRGEF